MKTRIVICDDEELFRTQTRDYTETLCRNLNIDAEFLLFDSAEALLSAYPKHMDILILDIAMNEMNGVDLAKEIRRRGDGVRILFTTSMAQYALEGYKVRAYSFLTKPLNYEEFRIEMTSAIESLELKRGIELLIKKNQETYRVHSTEIIYAEVQNHTLTLHCKGRTIEYPGNLSELEGQLANHGFARCHASYLVSLKQVARIGSDKLTLLEKTELPLSRSKRKEFLAAVTVFTGGTT